MIFSHRKLNRSDLWVAILLSLLVVGCALSQVVFGVTGVFHDDGIYVSTAKALAEGEGYRLINLPDAPFQTKYPILYPAFLAAIWKLGLSFPTNIIIMQLLNMLIGGASLAICYLYLVKFNYFDRKIAFAAMLLCACSHLFLYFTTVILSEMLFLFLTIIMLWSCEEIIKEHSVSPKRLFFTGILIALPFLCRTIGIIYIPLALFICHSQKYRIRWIVAGLLSVLLPYLLFVVSFYNESGNPGVIYYTDYGRWWMKYFFENVFTIAQFNILVIPFSVLMIGAEGICTPVVKQYGNSGILFFLLGVIPLVGMIVHDRRGILRYCVFAYLALILFWPWQPLRFIIPVAPFLIAYMLHTIRFLAAKFIPANICGFASFIFIAIIISANTFLLYQHYDQQQTSRYPRVSLSPPEQIVHWSSYDKMFRWLRAHSESSDVIACGLDSMVYLYTDRRAYRPFIANPISLFYGGSAPPLGSIEDFMELMKLNSPKYLIQVPLPDFAEDKHFDALLQNIQKNYPDLLIPVYVGDDYRFIIFEIRQ